MTSPTGARTAFAAGSPLLTSWRGASGAALGMRAPALAPRTRPLAPPGCAADAAAAATAAARAHAKRARASAADAADSDQGAGGPAKDTPSDTIEYFGGGSSAQAPLSGRETAPNAAPAFGSFAELPLFPLPLVLNPGSSIPLHIFEMRYRLMFNRVRDTDSKFGIVFYDKDKDAIAAIGCSAELTRFEPLPDGRIMTNNVGRERFRIINILEEKPYRRALVEYFHDDSPENEEVAELASLETKVWSALQDVLRLSNKLYDKALDLGTSIKELAPTMRQSPDDMGAAEANVAQAAAAVGTSASEAAEPSVPSGSDFVRTQDFSFAVSQILDMPVNEQQILLQTRKTSERLKKQSKMLITARQYLAAQVVIKDAGLKF